MIPKTMWWPDSPSSNSPEVEQVKENPLTPPMTVEKRKRDEVIPDSDGEEGEEEEDDEDKENRPPGKKLKEN